MQCGNVVFKNALAVPWLGMRKAAPRLVPRPSRRRGWPWASQVWWPFAGCPHRARHFTPRPSPFESHEGAVAVRSRAQGILTLDFAPPIFVRHVSVTAPVLERMHDRPAFRTLVCPCDVRCTTQRICSCLCFMLAHECMLVRNARLRRLRRTCVQCCCRLRCARRPLLWRHVPLRGAPAHSRSSPLLSVLSVRARLGVRRLHVRRYPNCWSISPRATGSLTHLPCRWHAARGLAPPRLPAPHRHLPRGRVSAQEWGRFAKLDKHQSKLGKLGPKPAELRPTLAKLGQFRPNLGRRRPETAKARPKFGKKRSTLAEAMPPQVQI